MSKERFFERTTPAKLPDDLTLLRGWAKRLAAWINDDVPPNHLAPMVYRPDRMAVEAMMRLSVDFPHVVKEIDGVVDYADKWHARLSEGDSAAENLADAMHALRDRVLAGVKVIEQAQARRRGNSGEAEASAPAARRLAAPRGSCEAQRWLAAEEADRVSASADDDLARLFHYAACALEQSVNLAKISRSKMRPPTDQFVAAQTRLAEYVQRIDGMPNLAALIAQTPADAGITFAWKAGASALDVAIQFASMVNSAVLVAREEIAVNGATSLDALPLHPTPDPNLDAWRDRTIRELREVTLPTDSMPWPMGEIHRDYSSLLHKLRASAMRKGILSDPEPAENAAAGEVAHDPHAPYMPADWFTTKYGIPAERLRAARRDGRLMATRTDRGRYHYSVPDAQRLWPDDGITLPE